MKDDAESDPYGATPRSPDHSECRWCDEPISWDDICYTHDSTGFAECGTVISGGTAPTGLIAKVMERAGLTGVVDPTVEGDPAWFGKWAEPITWN